MQQGGFYIISKNLLVNSIVLFFYLKNLIAMFILVSVNMVVLFLISDFPPSSSVSVSWKPKNNEFPSEIAINLAKFVG